MVKVYLFPDKHIVNCKVISPHLTFIDTHKLFAKIATASMDWMKKEIYVCEPKLIITLGEVAARTISNDWKTNNKELLNGEVRTAHLDKDYNIAHLGHPEIRRINKEWDDLNEKSITLLRDKISSFI